MVVLAGSNSVAIRFSVAELAPFWGAALRFGPAALLFALIALARGLPWPRGPALKGALLFGVLAFGLSFAFVYYGLVSVQAAQGSVIGAIVPLMTVVLAWAQGLEPFRWRTVAGGMLAMGGIAVMFIDQLSGQVPPAAFGALVLGSLAAAQAGVVAKRYPRTHPVTTNAVAMAAGAAVLLAGSLVWGEALTLPRLPATWAAVGYMVLPGSLGVFSLFMFLLRHWRISSISYSFVLMPFVATGLGALLAGERVGLPFFLGGALVLAGVYAGALASAGEPAGEPAQEGA
jgi:drug/metabolite transporter (DMT)-like permease